jgi:putative isomerase
VGEANRALQPPGALTWAALEIFQRKPDREFLDRVYPMLGRNNSWWYRHKDSDDNGLCEWARGDSGWDVSPRWARGEVEAIDLNCWLYLDQQLLARIATILGKRDEATDWRRRAARTKRLIQQRLWHERLGLFLDRLPDGKWIKVKTPAAYWAMFTGIATKDQAERMVTYLRDPRAFATTWPIPTVAADEPAYAPGSYANGSVLVNLNWLTILGLRHYHYDDLADWLESKTLDLVAREPFPREYYHPETGKGLQAQYFNWSGALFVRMAHDRAARR